MEEVSKLLAERFLSIVPSDRRFFACNGDFYDSLDSLYRGIRKLKAEQFSVHVNDSRNDFASWVYDVVGDTILAGFLRKFKSKRDIVNTIKDRITFLKVCAEQ